MGYIRFLLCREKELSHIHLAHTQARKEYHKQNQAAEYANLKIDQSKDGGIDKAFKGYMAEIVSIHNETLTW
jgi:hypothetical protein